MTLVSTVLGQIGPCSTQELSSVLVIEHGLRPDAARKRIQRARESREILTAGFNFTHNQQFVYLKRHEGTKLLRSNLLKTINKTNSALRFPLGGIKARGGVLPAELFPTFSGLPLSGRGPTADAALAVLLESGMVVKDRITGNLKLDPLFLNSPLDERKMKGRMSSEQITLAAFSDWLKLQGFISKDVDLRFGGTSTQFGFFSWDLKAPCSKYPLSVGFGDDRRLGYIVADVILGRPLETVDTDYFFHKCEVVRRNRKMPLFLAFLIAERFDYAVIMKAQSQGIVCTTPKNLFGRQLANLLSLLGELIEGKDFAISKTDDIIEKLGETLTQFDHLTSVNGNLRGTLFEVMIGHWLGRHYQGTVRYGRQLQGKSATAYDSEVLIDNPGTYLKAYECKNRPLVTLEDVEHWFGTVVPAIRQHYLMENIDRYPSQEFGIWTTGRFKEDALAALNRLKADCKKYTVTWFDGEETREKLTGLNDPRITQNYDSFLKQKTFRDMF